MTLRETVERFSPGCEQEAQDRRLMLEYIDRFPDVLTRENELAHFTASAWVTTPARDRVLMLYHNIYRSWAWPGGHADGDADLLAVALREVREETGAAQLRPASARPISLEILPVAAHFRRGRYVAPHLHLNLTYLIVAGEEQALRAKPDENSSVAWFAPEEAVAASTEPDMRVIYEKLNGRLFAEGE